MDATLSSYDPSIAAEKGSGSDRYIAGVILHFSDRLIEVFEARREEEELGICWGATEAERKSNRAELMVELEGKGYRGPRAVLVKILKGEPQFNY